MNGSVGPAFPADGPRNQVCSVKIFGCDNDLPLASRRDVRAFQTPPLSSDVVIAGPVSVDLWISSSAPDTDFTAKLVDVAPPSKDYPFGFAMNIEDRIIRVRWSDGFDKPVPLKSGEVRKVAVDLIAAGNRFAKCHRIRVDISSSNFPYFDANPNTGERGLFHTHRKGAEYCVSRQRTSVSAKSYGTAGSVHDAVARRDSQTGSRIAFFVKNTFSFSRTSRKLGLCNHLHVDGTSTFANTVNPWGKRGYRTCSLSSIARYVRRQALREEFAN